MNTTSLLYAVFLSRKQKSEHTHQFNTGIADGNLIWLAASHGGQVAYTFGDRGPMFFLIKGTCLSWSVIRSAILVVI